ncbi:MAG: CBS domain-containing protein [Syntrophomonadaceae bacterium]|nr:CBS domain-containing protein [Syntrophomonadaceae bacterium]
MMKVSEVMASPVVTVSARNSLQECLDIMRENNVRRLPVVEGAKLVGIIVQHDIEKALRSPGRISQTPVEWVMTKTDLFVVSPEDKITDAARLMKARKISALPVVEDGDLLGIITDSDLMGMLIRLLERQ